MNYQELQRQFTTKQLQEFCDLQIVYDEKYKIEQHTQGIPFWQKGRAKLMSLPLIGGLVYKAGVTVGCLLPTPSESAVTAQSADYFLRERTSDPVKAIFDLHQEIARRVRERSAPAISKFYPPQTPDILYWASANQEGKHKRSKETLTIDLHEYGARAGLLALHYRHPRGFRRLETTIKANLGPGADFSLTVERYLKERWSQILFLDRDSWEREGNDPYFRQSFQQSVNQLAQAVTKLLP